MMTDGNNNRRYYSIGVMRFVAASAVVLSHSAYYTTERLGAESVSFPTGGRGVDLFFVISGFVMAISSNTLSHDTAMWKIFAVHRIVRIVPLYWAATTFKIAVVLLTSGLALHASVNLWNIVASYLFIPSYNGEYIHPILHPGWTLNFEMFFYLVVSVSLFLFQRINIVFLSIILVSCAVMAPLNEGNPPAAYYYFDSIVLEFLAGALLAKYGIGFRINAVVGGVITCIGLYFLFISPVTPIHQKIDGEAPVVTLPRFIAFGIPAAIAIFGAIHMERLFSGRYLQLINFFADMSYALYLIPPLTAPIVPYLLKQIGVINPLLSVILTAFASFIFAVTAYFIYDRPVTRFLKKRIFKSYFVSHESNPNERVVAVLTNKSA